VQLLVVGQQRVSLREGRLALTCYARGVSPWILVPIAVCLGCHGAELETDAGTSDSSASDAVIGESGADAPDGDGAGSEDVPNNLKSNGSFEEGLTGWPDGRLVVVEGGADHGNHWAKLVDGEPWTGVSNRISVAAPAGTTFELGMSLKALDSDTSAMRVYVSTDDSETGEVFMPLSPAGTWIRAKATLTLTKPITSIVITVDTNVSTKRSFGIDRVYLVKK